MAVPLTEIIHLSRHLRVREIQSFMNLAPFDDLRDPRTPPPSPADDRGRSAQIFVMEVAARHGDTERRATASGSDIYAVTAPLVVEAAERILGGRAARGSRRRASCATRATSWPRCRPSRWRSWCAERCRVVDVVVGVAVGS